MNAQPLLVLILISMNTSWSLHTLPIKTRPDESSTLLKALYSIPYISRNINNIKSNSNHSNHKSADYNEQIMESPHTAYQGMPRVGVLHHPPSSDDWFLR